MKNKRFKSIEGIIDNKTLNSLQQFLDTFKIESTKPLVNSLYDLFVQKLNQEEP